MSIASGTRTELVYIAEVTQGTTPSTPTMKVLRATSRNVNPKKNILESNEMWEDRMERDVRHGFKRVEGSIGFELSSQSYDDWIEAALGGTWTTITALSTTVSATGTGFSTASGSFITNGYRVGDVVTAAGFTAPGLNIKYVVTSVAAGAIGTYPIPSTTEAAGSGKSITVTGQRCSIGTTLKTFTLERRFKDISVFQQSLGVSPTTMNVNITPEQIVGGSFGVIGMNPSAPTTATIASATTAAPTTSPFSSFKGLVMAAGAPIAIVTGLEIALNDNRSLEPVVASETSPEVFEGQAQVSGTLTAFLKDRTMLNYFNDETEIGINVRLDDPDGTNFHNIVMNRVKGTAGDVDPPKSGPCVIQFPYRALRDSTSQTSLSWQKSS